MPKINILSPLVADMIAAGEVVERPASAVKELIENSVDAGAKNITVELRSGGAEYIRVTDDGSGMAPEDAGVAFLRHATSKLHDERGLEAIGTLGFRGEALAAIGSVSHVELLTRERGKPFGTRLLIDGGEITDMSEQGCPEGSSIIVRGLFFNTPARLKFMKSDRAEGSACVAAALRCALARPEVSIRCIRDGNEEFFTPGDGRPESAAYSLLGREIAAVLLPASSSDGALAVSGFVSSPSAGRGSRSCQYFFCNGRCIKSSLLQTAVERAYRNTLLTGRFPACIIYLSVALSAVDVNVHPAKTEVKFSDEKRVFDAVYYAALGALEAPAAPPEIHPASIITHAEARPVFSPAAPHFSAPTGAPARFSAPREALPREHAYEPPDAEPLRQPSPQYQTRMDFFPPPAAPNVSAAPDAPDALEEDRPLRVIGEALGLYILVEKGDALILIDKHAAHERIIFDRLSAAKAEVTSQALLEPVPLNTDGGDAELISKNAELIASLGFEAEPYGESAFILRAAPAVLAPADALPAFEELLDALRKNLRPDPRALRDEALKTVACKAAIKAGRSSEPEETKILAEAVCAGKVRYCPHGRPVFWTLSRED
ncbi:MAG: DNA mismatch repair endonuclease MutL, partial [Oscillospiraceae bacterium]